MSRDWDTIFLPGEYCKLGDKEIKNPPLIDSSLFKLAEARWNLAVHKRWVPSFGHTKLKYHFYDPQNDYGTRFIVYKCWVGYLVSNDELIHILHEKDLTPRFTRPPSFSLTPTNNKYVDPVVTHTDLFVMDEYETIKRFNDERAQTLKPRKKNTKTSSLEEVMEKINNVVEFPTINEDQIEQRIKRAISGR